jgi:hypothetical protein
VFSDEFPTLSSEVRTENGWEVIGPALPKMFYVSCLISINETTIMLAG